MKTIVAVDGGGTGCRVRITDAVGHILAETSGVLPVVFEMAYGRAGHLKKLARTLRQNHPNRQIPSGTQVFIIRVPVRYTILLLRKLVATTGVEFMRH